MPLEQRVVEPICVSRGNLPLDSQGNLAISIPNELECVTNGSLANVIRELSSLSQLAEDLFGGILREATVIISRSTQLQGRIDRLAVKVTQLDSTVEEVSLHDIHLRKPFKSSSSYDQQVVARNTIPESLSEQYKLCDKPPPLNKLNPYRDDTKDGLTFYTDANYFFELWRQDMLKETEREKGGKKGAHRGPARGQNGPVSGEKNRQKKPRQPTNTRDKYRQMVAQQEFLDAGKGPMYMDQNGTIYSSGNYGTLQRPNSLDVTYLADNVIHYGQMNSQQAPAYYGTMSNQQQGHPGHAQQGAHANNHAHNNHVQRQSSQGSPSGQGMPLSPYSQLTAQELQLSQQQSQSQGTPTRRAGSVGPANRPSQPPPAPPSNPPSSSSSSGHGTPTAGTPRSRGQSLTREILPPPPPPPMEAPGMNHPPPPPPGEMLSLNGGHHDSDLPLPPASQQSLSTSKMPNNHIPASSMAPPPPPPPPPNGLSDSVDGNSKPSFAQQIQLGQKQLQPPKLSTMNKVLPQHAQQHGDARNGLLAAIREGIKLRRVEDSKQKEVEKTAPCNDVASILARRVAMELSDSESGGGGSGSDSDGWDDESEC